jgi:hypothetical protein
MIEVLWLVIAFIEAIMIVFGIAVCLFIMFALPYWLATGRYEKAEPPQYCTHCGSRLRHWVRTDGYDEKTGQPIKASSIVCCNCPNTN